VSFVLICDGCGKQLKLSSDTAISGKRADGMHGKWPLPNGEFHWCGLCAQIAFRAVESAKANKDS
jgi:hypothetical protein